MRRPEREEWTLEVAVRRAVHRQEKVREERLRRDERVVPTHPFGSERGLELALNPIIIVPRRRDRGIPVRPAVVPRIEYHVPYSTQRRKGIIGATVALMVPVVMMRHLRKR